MGFSVATLSKDNIAELIELRMAYLEADFGVLDPSDEQAIRQSLPAFFERHLDRDLFAFAIRAADGSIASLALMLISEKPPNPRFVHGRIGTVFNVYTDPRYRRQGLARKLITLLVADARERKLDLVELNATDKGYGLYRSLGFSDADLHRPMEIKP